jgi:hypothetical protein
VTIEEALAVDKLTRERDTLRKALKALVDAEWMVSHDWGGDREAVIDQAYAALRICPTCLRKEEE